MKIGIRHSLLQQTDELLLLLYVSTICAGRNILGRIIHCINKRLLSILHRLHSLLHRTHRSPIHSHGLIHRLRHGHPIPLLHHILHLPVHPSRNIPISHHIHRRRRNRRLRRYTSQPLDFATIRINATLLREIHRAVHRLHRRRRRSVPRRFFHDCHGSFFLPLRLISRQNLGPDVLAESPRKTLSMFSDASSAPWSWNSRKNRGTTRWREDSAWFQENSMEEPREWGSKWETVERRPPPRAFQGVSWRDRFGVK